MHPSFGALALAAFVASGLAPRLAAQPLAERYADLGTMIVTTSRFSMFPHESRAKGHTFEGKAYPARLHYNDSTVAIFVPKGFRAGEATDLVFWFHGWRNNVDDAFLGFRLAEQFAASGVNAVFVLPEGPKDAPDSSGGRLEEAGAFANLVADVLGKLKAKGLVPTTEPGSIVLAGHSGAYRVMAFILARGGLTANVREVYLFDALYGQLEKFAHWVDRTPGKLLAIHTAEGGTRDQTKDFMDDLRAWDIPFVAAPESAATPDLLRQNRLVFIESALTHDAVVAGKEQLRAFLSASALPRR
ncbi:MAG TPA: hypothetical protein PLB02_01225 [Thermoanaerobaculia bacterium]|nr:hypothetical protein [Thermoanaerobaculia bacterium]HQR65991.1 hypothetical protein [Thermoanaerobaculia bacterium]